jgi:hypothetical protein
MFSLYSFSFAKISNKIGTTSGAGDIQKHNCLMPLSILYQLVCVMVGFSIAGKSEYLGKSIFPQ